MRYQILPTASDRYAVETILRTVTTEMGSRSGVSMSPLSRATCQEYGEFLLSSRVLCAMLTSAYRIGTQCVASVEDRPRYSIM